jgi:hypothetical protein
MRLRNLLYRRQLAWRWALPALVILLGLWWTFSLPSRNAVHAQVHEKSAPLQPLPLPATLRPTESRTKLNETMAPQKLNRMTPGLPGWMLEYVKFFHSQLQLNTTTGDVSLKPDAKYLLWTCRLQPDGHKPGCGGIGDRINGIIQGLYMAICTNRVLLVEWTHPDPLTALEPALLPWNLAVNVPPARPVIRTIDNYQHPYLLNPTRLPQNEQGLELWGNLWLSEPIVRQTKCLREYWQRHGGLDDATHLYKAAFETLFHWSPANLERATKLKRRAGLTTSIVTATQETLGDSTAAVAAVRPYIAVHIRTGKGASWGDPIRHAGREDLRRFYQCARTIQQGVHDVCPPPSSQQQQQQHQSLLDVDVASDNNVAKKTLQQWDVKDCRHQNRNISTTSFRFAKLEVFHVDRSRKWRMWHPVAAALDVWAELLTLLDAVCLVTSRSGFSDLPTWVSPQQPRCQVRFDHCSAENVTIALQALRDAGCPSYT